MFFTHSAQAIADTFFEKIFKNGTDVDTLQKSFSEKTSFPQILHVVRFIVRKTPQFKHEMIVLFAFSNF